MQSMSFMNPWFYFQLIWIVLYWTSPSIKNKNDVLSVLWPIFIILALSSVLWFIVLIVVIKDIIGRIHKRSVINDPSIYYIIDSNRIQLYQYTHGHIHIFYYILHYIHFYIYEEYIL